MARHGLSRPPGEIVRKAPIPHDRWDPKRNTGTLRLSLAIPEGQFVSPGTGRLVLVATEDGPIVAQQAARAAAEPVIPGTGIKGAVRSLFELLSFSCDPLDSAHRCKSRECCDACSVFGLLGWSGRVSFGDARPVPSDGVRITVKKVPVPWKPDPEKTAGAFRIYDLNEASMLDNERRCQVKRPKELAREVYSGRFESTATFWNLTDEELGRLLYAMGAGEAETGFHLRLGSAKYDGKGAVRVTPLELRLASPKRETLTNADSAARCQGWMAVARASGWGKTFWPTLAAAARALEVED